MILLASVLAASQIAVASPDNRVSIALASDGGSYSVTRKGEQILAPSPLGLEVADGGDFSGLELVAFYVRLAEATARRHLLLDNIGAMTNEVARTTTDATRRDNLKIRMTPGGGRGNSSRAGPMRRH